MPHHVILFGDQTSDASKEVEILIGQARNSPSLKQFLELSTDALSRETAKLIHFERGRFINFSSILDLVKTQSGDETRDVVVSTVLLQIAQLGSLILNYESNADILPSSEVIVLGLCTGLLSAAAAASSKSLLDLVNISSEIVCLSFRVGFWAKNRSAQIEHGCGSWAAIVSEIQPGKAQEALDEFHTRNKICKHKRAYISATVESMTTISGPPSILDHLFATNRTFASAHRIVRLPIVAAFHANQLQRPDVSEIVGSSRLFDRASLGGRKIISTRNGREYNDGTLRDTLHKMVDDILVHPLCYTETIKNTVSMLKDRDVSFTTFGPTNAGQSFKKSFHKAGINVKERSSSFPNSSYKSESKNSRSGSGALAVVGMAGRFPGSENLEEFWDILERGKDLVQEVPADRFDADSHCDSTGARKNTSITPFGCFVERPGYFDTQLFNMSPREACQTDPTQRLILLTAYEALEMAGYSPDGGASVAPRRIGTFFGQTTDDWREANASQDIDLYYLPGGMRAFGPGRLNYHFKWEGPSYSLDTACSSSSAAIQLACSALLSRDCDMAVTGGGSINTGPSMFAGLSRGGFLSPTGNCKTFDKNADGYCRGDGVASVVLKRLEDAIADNDNIQGIIRGVATNHSAHAVSITHPHADTQKKLYQQVLEKAGVNPRDVSYIEMHGTGTQAGDIAEMTSVAGVFGQGRNQDNPLYVGAVKANVGHGEAAAGVTSLIKALLMMRKNLIPPHAGIKGEINPKLPTLDDKNIRIAHAPISFKANMLGDPKRKILINNFNATGGNTSMLVEEPPTNLSRGGDPRSHHLVILSARTRYSLKRNIERLEKHLMSYPETYLADISYSTTARRMHHPFRTSISSSNTTDLISKLKEGSVEVAQKIKTPSVAFVFTGQGSSYPGMGKTLFETNGIFRKVVIDCDNLCAQMGFPSILGILIDTSIDLETLAPIQAHLSIVTLEIALAQLWMSWGIRANVMIGHSLGEYAALFVSEALSLSDTLFLVGQRARLIQDLSYIPEQVYW